MWTQLGVASGLGSRGGHVSFPCFCFFFFSFQTVRRHGNLLVYVTMFQSSCFCNPEESPPTHLLSFRLFKLIVCSLDQHYAH